MILEDRHAHAALAALIILQLVMLVSLYAGVQPHPPAAIPLFAIAPFLAASLALAGAAMVAGPASSRSGRALSAAAALAALVSFGPQKFFDAQFGLIWPAVLAGQAAAAVLLATVFRSRPARPA